MKAALTIAGSDSGGGAGIQADLKTFQAFGLFGTSAITSITAQNSLGVSSRFDLQSELVVSQVDAVFTDFPLEGIKIGMLGSSGTVAALADYFESTDLRLPIILDPVMVATSGDRLLEVSAASMLLTRLMPVATLITPNVAEGLELLGKNRELSANPFEIGRELIKRTGTSVLLTGVIAGGEIVDYLFTEHGEKSFVAPKIESDNTHGTGCTLSSAILSSIVLGEELVEAIDSGREYVRRGIVEAPGFGNGNGPLNHLV